MSIYPLENRIIYFTIRCETCGEEAYGLYPEGTRFVHQCPKAGIL